MGFRLPRPTAQANIILYPDRVLKIHQSHVKAGAQIILTNTFGCSDLPKNIRKKSIQAGVKLAKEAAGKSAWVLGSIGPSLNRQGIEECANALVQSHVDGILFETFFTRSDILHALQIAKKLRHKVPVLLSMTVNSKGMLLDGTSPFTLINTIERAGVVAIGFNCSAGPSSLIKPVRFLSKKTRLPILIKPNAGLPQKKKGKLIYPIVPEVFAKQMQRLIKAGATLIGGCCGTQAGHIRNLKRIVKV